MNEEQKEALEILKGLEFEEYDWYVKTDKIEGHANDVVEKVEKALETILHLIDKQQKEIKRLKDNLVEERAFSKSTLETLKNCVDKDYLHKMISFKDGEIEKLKEAYQTLKDDIEGHRIAYVDTPEFEENYISKDKIKGKIKLLKDIKKANCYKQLTEDYIKGAIEQLEELLQSGQESDQEGGQEDE